MTSDTPSPAATLSVPLEDESATTALGRRIGQFVKARSDGLIIYLSGDLGAGKTTLVRGLLRALGVTGRIKSPTYALVEPYLIERQDNLEIRDHFTLYCYHFDFYRLEDQNEWRDAGFREYFDDQSLCLVEWPERADGLAHLRTADLHVTLNIMGQARVAFIEAFSERGAACLAAATS